MRKSNKNSIDNAKVLNNDHSVYLSKDTSTSNYQVCNTENDLERMKVKSHIFKNLFKNETGEFLKNLKLKKPLIQNNKMTTFYTSGSSNSSFSKIGEKILKLRNFRETENDFKEGGSNMSSNSLRNSLQSEKQRSLPEPMFKFGSTNRVTTKVKNIKEKYLEENESDSDNSINIRQEPLSSDKLPFFKNSFLKMSTQNIKQFYCPHCQHCNEVKDDRLEEYFSILKESKSIISKTLDFIINNNMMENFNLDFFSTKDKEESKIFQKRVGNDSKKSIFQTQRRGDVERLSTFSKKSTIEYKEHTLSPKISKRKNTEDTMAISETIFLTDGEDQFYKKNENDEKINIKRIKTNNTGSDNGSNTPQKSKPHSKIDLTSISSSKDVKYFEQFISTLPKPIMKKRLTYQVLFHCLDSILENRATLDSLIGKEVYDKVKSSLLAQGLGYSEYINTFNENNFILHIDKELEKYFDPQSVKIIKNLLNKSEIRKELYPSLKEDPISYEEFLTSKMKFLYLFLVFIEILSEISVECKEKAILLYKFFKIYFTEQEKKWLIVIERFKNKVKYYKELCKLLIQQKNKHLDRIEDVAEVLAKNRVTQENLQLHKNMIHDLLKIINEKRDEIYLKQSKIEILEKEMNFWLHDFEFIKLDQTLRDKIKEIDVQKIAKNVKEELSHKGLSRAERSILVNADVFLLISGQRNYFYDQKVYFMNEIERLQQLFQKNKNKKREWKKKFQESELYSRNSVIKLENELFLYREKENSIKSECIIQTEIDNNKMNKLIKNHESIVLYKNLNSNRLINFIERIKFNCTQYKPLSKKSLLNLIPEILNEKIQHNNKCEMENLQKKKLDIFFYEYMQEKFKMKKLVNQHCEETIMSVLKYSGEDTRIDMFRKFLGISDDKYRKDILDLYLIILKCKFTNIYLFNK
jgi:hypothetical protein